MDNYDWPDDLLHYKLKTKRQKRRLLIEDKNKRLLQLDKRQNELSDLRDKLPMIPLQEPFQRGWKRRFVLRDDVKRSARAGFYLALLEKINTEQHCVNKAFKKRVTRRRKRQRVYEDIPQFLEDFSVSQWNGRKLKLTVEEKEHFHLQEFWNESSGTFYYRYVFSELWRYVLQVSPRIITHARLVDTALAQEIGELDYHIKAGRLQPILNKLTRGRRWKWRGSVCFEKPKYAHPFKNKAFHTILDESTNY